MWDDGCVCGILGSVREIGRPAHLRKVSMVGEIKGTMPFTWEGGERVSFEEYVWEYVHVDHMSLVSRPAFSLMLAPTAGKP